MRESSVEVSVRRVRGGAEATSEMDAIAVEEPLEIRLRTGDAERAIYVTMRTPGADVELAAGFLFGEGIVKSREDVVSTRHCGPTGGDGSFRNAVRVELAASVAVDVRRLERHFAATSSCGVCGKSSIDSVVIARPSAPKEGPRVTADVIHALPAKLRSTQPVFERTGGLHAAALFDARGELLLFREDVGRHNAVDKLVGAELLAGHLPLHDRVLMLSGRASFELVQKAMMASVPIVAAVGAPSSLAVTLARECGITLLGFVRDGRFNVYAGEERVALS